MRPATARSGWLTGVVIGALGGFLLLELPPVGLAIATAAAVLARLAGQAVAGVAGLLVGLGTIWVLVFGRVKLTCSVANGCEAPTIDSYLIVAAGFLAVGAAASIVALVRTRQRS